MVVITNEKPAYRIARGDILVFPPRAMDARALGRHRKLSDCELLEGSGEYEVCGTMLADGTVFVSALDRNLINHRIRIHFKANVKTLEYV